MAVATPVLEKTSNQEIEDKLHNSLIRERYAKLVNPDVSISELKTEMQTPAEPMEDYGEKVSFQSAAEQFSATESAAEKIETSVPEIPAEPYLVPGGRADGELFRADSALNMRLRSAQNISAVAPAPDSEEEENEDLRPTSTTIQYKTENMKADAEEGGKISTGSKKHLHLSNRDIIIIAAVVTVIVALFVLIIINSAIISGLNSDLGSLQSSLNTVKGAYSGVSDQISDYVANHLEEAVKRLGESYGMVK